MSNGDSDGDPRYYSRKWIMACRVFWTATINHAVLQLLILAAMVLGKLDPATWSVAAGDLAMVWVWSVAAVLGLYGLANVMAIKFRNASVDTGPPA
jgi:hypothetical protein